VGVSPIGDDLRERVGLNHDDGDDDDDDDDDDDAEDNNDGSGPDADAPFATGPRPKRRPRLGNTSRPIRSQHIHQAIEEKNRKASGTKKYPLDSFESFESSIEIVAHITDRIGNI
jgi:hypothetical protein